MPQEPNVVESLYSGGYLLAQRRLLREASALFRLMITVAPSDVRGWIGLGFCHEGLGHVDAARKFYARGAVLAEDPTPCFRSLETLERKHGTHEVTTRVVSRSRPTLDAG